MDLFWIANFVVVNNHQHQHPTLPLPPDIQTWLESQRKSNLNSSQQLLLSSISLLTPLPSTKKRKHKAKKEKKEKKKRKRKARKPTTEEEETKEAAIPPPIFPPPMTPKQRTIVLLQAVLKNREMFKKGLIMKQITELVQSTTPSFFEGHQKMKFIMKGRVAVLYQNGVLSRAKDGKYFCYTFNDTNLPRLQVLLKKLSN